MLSPASKPAPDTSRPERRDLIRAAVELASLDPTAYLEQLIWVARDCARLARECSDLARTSADSERENTGLGAATRA